VRPNIEVVPDALENVRSFYNINYEHQPGGPATPGPFHVVGERIVNHTAK
jgi:hypothetical protein